MPEALTVAVVLGAGQGTRMGVDRNKIFLPLAGKPILAHALAALSSSPAVDEVLLVAHPNEVATCQRDIVRRYDLARVSAVIAGGASRHQSEDRALAHLRPRIEAGAIAIVLVHDGARPFVTVDDIDRLISAARDTGGAMLATPAPADETIAELDDSGAIVGIIDNAGLWRAQTPQAFDAATLLAAYDLARRDGFAGTDTASSYERLGCVVRVVPGSPSNIKVTTPEDLARVEWMLRKLTFSRQGLAARHRNR